MKNKILLLLSIFLLPIILTFAILMPNYIGNIDYEKTIMVNCSEELDTSSDRFVLQVTTNNKKFERWELLDIYNKDFYNERFSVAFRVSSNDFLATINDETKITIKNVSDIIESPIENNYSQNMSGLKISQSMVNFSSNSIILSEYYRDTYNLNIGDKLKFDSLTGENEFIIYDFYEKQSPADFTNNSYLNNTYMDFENGVAFLGRKSFELLTNNFYDTYFSLGKEKNRVIACYREIKPFLNANSATLSIPDHFQINNKMIGNMYYYDYPNYLEINFSKIKKISIAFSIISPIAVIILLLALYRLFIPHISKALSNFSVKTSLWICFGYLVFVIGSYVLGSFISTDVLANSIFAAQFYLFDSSLRWLVAVGLFNIAFLYIATYSNIFYNKVIMEYEDSKLSLSNLIKCETNMFENKKTEKTEKLSLEIIDSFDKKILFFGRFTAPTTSAGACRTLYLGKLFNNLGYTPFISSFTAENELGLFKYDDVYLLPYAKQPKTAKEKINLFLNSKKEIEKIFSAFNKSKPDIVVIYSVLSVPAVKLIKKYCFKNNIKLIFDVVESQVVSQQSFNSFFTYYLPQKYINSIAINKKSSVIAISSFLNETYEKKGINSLIVPFISDTSGTRDCTNIDASRKKYPKAKYILYAGNPFNKRDLLAPIFESVRGLTKEEKESIKIIIAGVDINQLLKREGVKKDDLLLTKDNIIVLGKVPHSTIEELYEVCDFSILIKPLKKKFSKAGFPTKVSESMAHGVPSICNMSSDLQLYLTETNSVLVNGDRAEDVTCALKKVINMNEKEIIKMRIAARKTSQDKLDINSSFIDEIRKFIH